MKRSEVDKNKLSPVMRQYVEIKEANEDSIIFFRLGDFYEMFFEDAVEVSRELELTLTGKSCGLEERVPMCGIPYHAYKGYLDKLIEKGYKVAIVEQITDPKESKGMVERAVVQVVTKGTRLDDSINSNEDNYIGNIYDFEYCYGISFSDISTGYFYVTMVNTKEEVIKTIINHNMGEVIVSSKVDRSLVQELREIYQILVTFRDTLCEDEAYSYLSKHLKDVRMKTTVAHLLSYLMETKKGDLLHLQEVEVLENNTYLSFDIHTRKNLELTETIRNHERTYSLLWYMDKTKTAMGSRYLKRNLENPILSKKELNRRYDFIEKLLTEFILKEELRNSLDQVYDLERLASRISYGNLNARDLIQLKNSLYNLPEIKRILTELEYDKQIETFTSLYELLSSSISDDAPISLKEGSLIKEGYNKELDNLRDIRKNSKNYILKIEQEERERTGIKNLKIGFNKVFGYFIEISNGNKNQIKDEFGYIRKQTLSTGERYITNELKELEDTILGAEEKIINLEYQLFMGIRDEVRKYTSQIQRLAKVIAEVDMLQAFAYLAEENKLVRPNLVNEGTFQVKEGRHPVVEKVSKQEYVPNDIVMGKETDILLITGPNMAGKSTYMRQAAIIVVMAQVGSFVPAASCTMPIFDKIFTRIGASDDLVSGESTFMVEMKEANAALQNATKNSLILFDELGRGTATYDGMSLAQAILEYIHDEVKCKTFFSTHYHELTSLSGTLANLKNVHVSAKEEDGKITFLHKIKSGAVDKSYGIHVASLANLPKKLIKRAEDILNVYEKSAGKKETFTQTTLFLEEPQEEKISIIEEKIKDIDPFKITPIDALNILYELKKEVEEKDKK